MVRYYLINDYTLVKAEFNSDDSFLADKAYCFKHNQWMKIDVNEVNDRLVGYDPSDDSFYGFGNMDIMDEIKEISADAAKLICNKK